jgi:hypothetical protein
VDDVQELLVPALDVPTPCWPGAWMTAMATSSMLVAVAPHRGHSLRLRQGSLDDVGAEA